MRRLLDRSAFGIDPLAAAIAAHDALLTLELREGTSIFTLDEVVLPTGSGYFIGRPRHVGVAQSPVIIARTWLSDDQGDARRGADAEAWRNLIALGTKSPCANAD